MLVEKLKGIVPGYIHVHDFDEGGVPSHPDKEWRIRRTEYWLLRARTYLGERQSTVVCGVCVPEEIHNSHSFDESLEIGYGFLYVGEQQIRKRLGERMWELAEIDGNIAWARYLEQQVRAQPLHYVVDSGKNNPNEVAQKIAAWITQEIK